MSGIRTRRECGELARAQGQPSAAQPPTTSTTRSAHHELHLPICPHCAAPAGPPHLATDLRCPLPDPLPLILVASRRRQARLLYVHPRLNSPANELTRAINRTCSHSFLVFSRLVLSRRHRTQGAQLPQRRPGPRRARRQRVPVVGLYDAGQQGAEPGQGQGQCGGRVEETARRPQEADKGRHQGCE